MGKPEWKSWIAGLVGAERAGCVRDLALADVEVDPGGAAQASALDCGESSPLLSG